MFMIAIVINAVLSAIASCQTLERDLFLLLDDRVIERTENARLAVGQVTKSEHNPLFVEDRPWEVRFDNLYANVLYDKEEKLYKCWYSPFIVDRSAQGMTFEERTTRDLRTTGGSRDGRLLCRLGRRPDMAQAEPGAYRICWK